MDAAEVKSLIIRQSEEIKKLRAERDELRAQADSAAPSRSIAVSSTHSNTIRRRTTFSSLTIALAVLSAATLLVLAVTAWYANTELARRDTELKAASKVNKELETEKHDLERKNEELESQHLHELKLVRQVIDVLEAQIRNYVQIQAAIEKDADRQLSLLTNREKEQLERLKRTIESGDLSSMTSSDIEFAFNGSGAYFLRKQLIEAADDGGFGIDSRINELHRYGFSMEESIGIHVRYKGVDGFSLVRCAAKLHAGEIDDAVKRAARRYPELRPLLLKKLAEQNE